MRHFITSIPLIRICENVSLFLAHRQLLKSTFVKDLNRSIAGSILGEGAERSCQFLKDKKQLIEVVETEGLGLICFSLIGVNVRQSD